MLVLGGIISVQFGGALAQTLIPTIGAGGSVVMRLLFATVLLLVVIRPRWRGHSRAAWTTVVLFGTALGLMNYTFYGSLAHLPIGVLLISQALRTPLAELNWPGLGLALAAGCFWAAYIVLSGRTGAEFAKLDGLALAMVVATLITLPFGIMSVPSWTGETVAKGLGIALLSSVLPYSLELLALRRLSAQVFGILLSLEPAFAALAGLLVLGQVLEGEQLLGMSLVVLASAMVLGFGSHADPAESAAT